MSVKTDNDAAKQDQKFIQLQFPSNLGAHRLILYFYEYDYSRTVTGKGKQNIAAQISMPLPQNIIDQSRLEIGGSQLGFLGGAAADALGTLYSGDSVSKATQDIDTISKKFGEFTSMSRDEMLEAGKKLLGNVGSIGKNASAYIVRALAGSISPQIAQAAGATSGTALNNQATLIFDGVDLKIHNFEWLLSPKNKAESDELDKVIQTINYYIHPAYKNPLGQESATLERTVNRGLLTYPALMEIELQGVSGGLKQVFRSGKFYMVNNFNADYTPQGVVLNKGGTANMVRCSMNTTESRIRTRDDYLEGLPGATVPDEAPADTPNEENINGDPVPPAPEDVNQQQGDPVEDNDAQDTSTEAEDNTPAYKVARPLPVGQGSAVGQRRFDLYTAQGKKVKDNVSQGAASSYPTKSSFQANPPVDR